MNNRSTLRKETVIMTQTAIFAAIALVIGWLESLLPSMTFLPPGAKPGFSNVVTMYVAGTMGIVPAMSIAVIKGCFAFLTRGLTAGMMSLCGGVLSTLVMFLFFKFSKNSGFVGIGIAGAITHNATQLGVAALLTGASMMWYAPWLLGVGIIAGTLTGVILNFIMPLLDKITPAYFFEKE